MEGGEKKRGLFGSDYKQPRRGECLRVRVCEHPHETETRQVRKNDLRHISSLSGVVGVVNPEMETAGGCQAPSPLEGVERGVCVKNKIKF